MGVWYLGPAGALTQIRAPARGLETSPELIGAVQRSLNGGVTVDRVAQPRSWPLKWPVLTEAETTYLRLVGQGQVRGPLRLIDPEITNRLPVRVAGGGSYRRSATDFTQTGGNDPTYVAITDPPATVPVRGAISWTRSTTAAGTLTTANALDRVPLLSGEQVRVFQWARGTPIQVSAALDAWDALDAAARTTGTAATLDPVLWTYLEVLYTPPPERILLSEALEVAAGQPASTVQTTGWMVAPASAPTTWAPAGGGPVVVAGSELTETYLLPGLREFGITLLERSA